MSEIVQEGEYVVDMFACVGQFALHMAKKENVLVKAIEINPRAYKFLTENIVLNRLEEKVTAVFGNNREVSPRGVANRIVMGYLHNTLLFLPIALKTLSTSGGVVHMHLATAASDVADTCNTINNLCGHYSFRSEIEVRKIKNYSPGIGHYVFDITCSPLSV
jgi:tRNA wybutosine-synthesizing protein 2